MEPKTPEETEVWEGAAGNVYHKLIALKQYRLRKEMREKPGFNRGVQEGERIALKKRRDRREPKPEARLTKPMSATELAKLIETVDARGERFIEKFIDTSIIAARQKSKRKWVFDADELQDQFPSIDADQILPE